MWALVCLGVGAALPAAGEPAGEASLGPVESLARAFEPRSADEPLEARVDRVRAEASRMGMWSAEPAARGLLLAEGLGSESDRAAAAVRLAPGLPAAWGALAASSSSLAAIPALGRGLVEMERNLDASVWWRATALRAFSWALVAGGLLFLVLSALQLAPAAAHDLAHRLPGRLPPHAIASLMASLGVLPVAAGEGLIGLAAGAFVVAIPWAGTRHRGALIASMVAVLSAVHPLTDETGRWIEALHADPGTVAIRNAEVSGLSVGERERLERLAPRDPAAGHALSLVSRRADRLEEAERWLEVAGARDSDHPVLLNGAANVRFAAGDADEAIALYERANRSRRDAAVLFNLAQVHGSRIELAHQGHALEAAHAVSAATVRELSELRGNGRLVVDLPWPVRDLRSRLVRAADGRAVAATLRAPFGAGRLVTMPMQTVGVLAALAVAGLLIGRGRLRSDVCALCGARRCDRCARAERERCPACGAPAGAASPLRVLQAAARPALLRVVPGLAGLAADRPWFGFVAALCATTGVAAFVLRGGVVTDPLAAGLVGQAAFLIAAAAALLVSTVTTALALRSLR